MLPSERKGYFSLLRWQTKHSLRLNGERSWWNNYTGGVLPAGSNLNIHSTQRWENPQVLHCWLDAHHQYGQLVIENFRVLFLWKKKITLPTWAFYSFGKDASGSELPCFGWLDTLLLLLSKNCGNIAVTSSLRDGLILAKINHQCKQWKILNPPG